MVCFRVVHRRGLWWVYDCVHGLPMVLVQCQSMGVILRGRMEGDTVWLRVVHMVELILNVGILFVVYGLFGPCNCLVCACVVFICCI